MSTHTHEPIKPNYDLPWVRGHEYVIQEGSGYIQQERERRGWSREDVYALTDYMLDPNTQGLIEGEYGVGIPWEIDHLVSYAVLFDTTPGALLDAIYETKGRELIAEDEREDTGAGPGREITFYVHGEVNGAPVMLDFHAVDGETITAGTLRRWLHERGVFEPFDLIGNGNVVADDVRFNLYHGRRFVVRRKPAPSPEAGE